MAADPLARCLKSQQRFWGTEEHDHIRSAGLKSHNYLPVFEHPSPNRLPQVWPGTSSSRGQISCDCRTVLPFESGTPLMIQPG